jgi:hypothetical protein
MFCCCETVRLMNICFLEKLVLSKSKKEIFERKVGGESSGNNECFCTESINVRHTIGRPRKCALRGMPLDARPPTYQSK